MPKTIAEKSADYRERKKKNCLKLVRLHVHSCDEPALRACAKILNAGGDHYRQLCEFLDGAEEENQKNGAEE
jgi:hypothetical protein